MLNGTLKKGGDKKTSSYYLKNTGSQEANLAITLEKDFSEKLKTTIYASTFNTELGVLRGSHISNITDLEQAFQREIPFFTEDNFSYAIDAPKQKVNHHLIKAKTSYFLNDTKWFNITLASQLNLRKEFDVRRSGRTDIPALSLTQYALFFEGKYHSENNNGWKTNSGIQVNIIDNTNNPETGILPLIPDYISYESGAFVTFQKSIKMSLIEFGLRYNNFIQNVVTISKDVNPQIIRFQNIYNNLSSSAGWRYKANDKLSYSINLGFGQRSPGINELYSGGLHQGVSGIEEGNLDLKTESSLKSTFTILADVSDHISFESLLYFQNIGNYIYLEPQDEIRLTIRGAFPVFKYEQTQAQIYGLDLNANIDFSESIKSTFGYSYIKGKDVTNKVFLVNIPSNVLTSKLGYESIHAIKIGNSKFENLGLEINGRYVFKQNDITSDQDFVIPPEAYFLLGLEMSTEIQISSTRLRWILKAENILNVQYRDYLNRQRYFADDIGLNLITGFNLKF
jgi:iron complex outermembrane receptor protein